MCNRRREGRRVVIVQPEQSPTPVPQRRSIPLDWSGASSLPVLAANQLLVQLDIQNDGHLAELILTIGHASPPPITGTPEEQAEKAKEVKSVAVTPLARVSLASGRLDEWIDLLVNTRKQMQAMRAEGEKS